MEKDIDEKKWDKVLKNGKTYGENYLELQQLDQQYKTALHNEDYKALSKIKAERNKLYKVFGPTGRPLYVENASYRDSKGNYMIAQITKRKCGEKQQPELQVGRRYFIVGRDKTPTGIDVVLLANLKAYKKSTDIVASIRCNAKRFEWKEMTQREASIESMTYYRPVIDNLVEDIRKNGIETPEEKLKKSVQHDVKLFLDKLTLKEQTRVSFIPLVIRGIAWEYAFMALDCAARDRVSLLKKQSRKIRELNRDYTGGLRKDMSFKMFSHLIDQTNMCIKAMSRDLSILYFSANNEFKRCVPDYPYDQMRTYAIISQLFFSFAMKWNHDIDEFLAEKFPDEKFAPTLLPPDFKKLYPLMESIAGVDGKFDYIDKNIVTSMCVIENRIKSMEFSVIHDKD